MAEISARNDFIGMMLDYEDLRDLIKTSAGLVSVRDMLIDVRDEGARLKGLQVILEEQNPRMHEVTFELFEALDGILEIMLARLIDSCLKG